MPDIEAIKARCEAAWRGPWTAYVTEHYKVPMVFGPGQSYQLPDVKPYAGHVADDIITPATAAFIAHARTDVPALVAEVERLTVELDDWRTSADRAMRGAPDEEHCTCVPLLRMEVERLRAQLDVWAPLMAVHGFIATSEE